MREPGRLQVCATPIGNLGDVTLRVLDVLRTADTVLAEDTRVTRKLFARYEITTPLERYDEITADRRTPEIVTRLLAGETLALVSDAGTPGVSDPGSRLVDACIDAGIGVDVLPGASAILAALVASGLPTHAFYFGGFLPRKAGERVRLLDSLAPLDATLIFYESPKRTAAALAALAQALPGRRCAMGRELTKLHEEVVRGSLDEVAADVAARETLKGEVVLLIGPPPARVRNVVAVADVGADVVLDRVEQLVASGLRRTAAVKQASREMGISRDELYDLSARGRG